MPPLTSDLLELYTNESSKDILRATRMTTQDSFSMPALIAELDVTADQSTPELSTDGLTLYFGSSRPGSFGAVDIWVSTRPTRTAAWIAPEQVPELSTPAGDHLGCITADGLEIALDSRRLGSDDDLFIATRSTTNTPWSTPVVLAQLSAQGFNDESPCLSGDGLELYFNSNRTGTSLLYVARRDSRASEFAAPEQLVEIDSGYRSTGSLGLTRRSPPCLRSSFESHALTAGAPHITTST